VRDDLRRLLAREAVIHRLIQVIRNLRDLTVSDEGTDGDKATVPWREVRPQPQIMEENIRRVLHEAGSQFPELFAHVRLALRFSGFIKC
jgi:hypothetical protein